MYVLVIDLLFCKRTIKLGTHYQLSSQKLIGFENSFMIFLIDTVSSVIPPSILSTHYLNEM